VLQIGLKPGVHTGASPIRNHFSYNFLHNKYLAPGKILKGNTEEGLRPLKGVSKLNAGAPFAVLKRRR
jgi:hypothetical protein